VSQTLPGSAMSTKARMRQHQEELAQAEQLIVSGRGGLARMLLEGMTTSGPASADVYRLLAIEALEDNDPGRCLQHALKSAQLAPRDANVLMLLGRAHKLGGDLAQAETAYRTALRLNPRLATACVSLGIVLKARGEIDEAIASFQQALALDPNLSSARVNLGAALATHIRAADPSRSAVSSDALTALQELVFQAPSDVAARHNLALALVRSGRAEEAVDHLNRALALDPSRQDSCIALHAVLARLAWQEGARQCCERWLALNPPDVEVVNRLVTTLLALRDFEAAAHWVAQARLLAPDMPEVLHNSANLLHQTLQVSDAIAHLRRCVEVAPAYLPAWQTLLMCLNYVEEDPLAIGAEHRRFGRCHHSTSAPRWKPEASPSRVLRIGWLSGDLRRHSVAYFMEPLFEAHDPSRAQWIVYDSNAHPDEVTARLRPLSQGWVQCAGLSDADLAKRIRDDRIDILVDLSGHTADSRIAVLDLRPAPVQMTYLGYPTTTGMPTVDWRLTDSQIDPNDGLSEQLSVERLLRFRHSMFCYRPDYQGLPGPSPWLQRQSITFGSFNNLAKVTSSSVRLWSAVLRAVPGSRLLLKALSLNAPSVQQRLNDLFALHGVGPDRLVFNPWQSDLVSHLDLYNHIDIALDTYPYNGATTTCEALWMGVPVLTLRGRTHVSRMGASILTAAGLPEWVADDELAFVAMATKHAAEGRALSAMRAGLRARLLSSPLMNSAAQAADLQSLFDTAWAAQACNLEPESEGRR
jgi:protein O-GlcNAc transferase